VPLERGLHSGHGGQGTEPVPAATGGVIGQIRPIELERAQPMDPPLGLSRIWVLVSHRVRADLAVSIR